MKCIVCRKNQCMGLASNCDSCTMKVCSGCSKNDFCTLEGYCIQCNANRMREQEQKQAEMAMQLNPYYSGVSTCDGCGSQYSYTGNFIPGDCDNCLAEMREQIRMDTKNANQQTSEYVLPCKKSKLQV